MVTLNRVISVTPAVTTLISHKIKFFSDPVIFPTVILELLIKVHAF